MTFKAKLKTLLQTAVCVTLDKGRVVSISDTKNGAVRLEVEAEADEQVAVRVFVFADQEVEIDDMAKGTAKDDLGDVCELLFIMLRPMCASDMPDHEPESSRLKSIFEGKL